MKIKLNNYKTFHKDYSKGKNMYGTKKESIIDIQEDLKKGINQIGHGIRKQSTFKVKKNSKILGN